MSLNKVDLSEDDRITDDTCYEHNRLRDAVNCSHTILQLGDAINNDDDVVDKVPTLRFTKPVSISQCNTNAHTPSVSTKCVSKHI